MLSRIPERLNLAFFLTSMKKSNDSKIKNKLKKSKLDSYMFNAVRKFLRAHGILHTCNMSAQYIVVNHGQLCSSFVIYFEDLNYVRVKSIPLPAYGKEFLFIAKSPE